VTRFIGPLIIGASTGGVSFATSGLENQPIGIATAVSIACFTGGACLWLAKQFERRDKNEIERTGKINERLARIEQKLEDLPCKELCKTSDERRHR